MYRWRAPDGLDWEKADNDSRFLPLVSLKHLACNTTSTDNFKGGPRLHHRRSTEPNSEDLPTVCRSVRNL